MQSRPLRTRALSYLRAALALGATAILSAAPVAAEVAARTVAPSATFDAGMLRVERFGVAGRRPLIFIPALYCGSWQWNRQIAALAASSDIYAVTLPGFDGRPFARTPHLMERAAHSLAQLIRERRIRRPVVIGHSLGGTLAVLFGETYPVLAGGIIAVEGGYPIAATAAARERRANAASKPYLGVDAATFVRTLRANQLQYVITSKNDVDTVAKYAGRSDPTAVALWMRAALSLDLTPKLGVLRVPFTEIVPYSKAIDPYNGFVTFAAKRNAYAVWLAHAGGGHLVMIDDARHFVMFDRPHPFDIALHAAIARARPSSISQATQAFVDAQSSPKMPRRVAPPNPTSFPSASR
jgi:pimeloyl-ACP methyl ester carboxylesterase